METVFSITISDGIIVISLHQKPDSSKLKETMYEVAKIKESNLRLWILEGSINFTRNELEDLALYAKQILPTHSKAAIVAEDDLSFGLMRVHDVYRQQEHHETRVFRSKKEAIKWLKRAHS